jgi:hypothetical protein
MPSMIVLKTIISNIEIVFLFFLILPSSLDLFSLSPAYGLQNIAYGVHNIAYGLHNIANGLHNIAYGLHSIAHGLTTLPAP